MKKLGLRSEYLGELSVADLRQVAGAAGAEAPASISDGSCVCTIPDPFALRNSCDVSDGSCGCFCQTVQTQ